jgi:alpha-methylacyl-CoA racemase
MAGLGPAPFCAMLLADLGAEVIRVDRQQAIAGRIDHDPKTQVLNRGRRSVAVDLKNPDGVATVMRLVERADALIEGFRPGVMERLGLGPTDCHARNGRLVYGRMTGWGQDGPLAQAPGHDINYIAITGVLHAVGRRDGPPVPPLNLVGDFGGGLYLALGLVSAILESRTSGKGQVIDAAMVDAAASMMAYFFGFHAAGYWKDERGTNYIDTGSPFYDVYRTKDDRWLAIGSVEEKFWLETLRVLGIDPDGMPGQHDRSRWDEAKARVAAAVATRTRDEWAAAFDGKEACASPVLSLAEVPGNTHIAARATVVERDGIPQPAPAPRFSRTVPELDLPPPARGEHSAAVLADWGFTADEIAILKGGGAIA